MSLINRVLKDLEKRRAREVEDPGTLPPEVRPAAGGGPRKLPAYTWLLGLALIVAALGWWWSERMQPAGPAPVMQEPAPTTLPVPNAERAGEEQPADPALPDPVAVAPQTPEMPETTPASPPEPSPAVSDPLPEPEMEPPAPAPRTPALPSPDASGEGAAPDDRNVPGRIDKQVHPLDAAERAEQQFRRGMDLFRGGRPDEAEAAWRAALEIDPAAAAPRQALLGALLERGERERAENLLQDGLRANPKQPKQIMLLARLQLDRGAQSDALRTLEQGLPHAQWNAEYLSMTAAVMSRVGRHRDAADLYGAALRIAPANGVWEMGRGMALRADGQRAPALAAFQRASQMQGLSPELRAFVERQIRELQ
ncbi:MAG: tetratricopeptide repeat protein [Burkholderiales bacterium]|nr:tetratricopeptide repeat protein [Burkholderiales bacterium]